MAINDTKDLNKFLKPFPAPIIKTVNWLREFVWKLYPETNELLYDNYNAVAIGWSITDRVSHVFCNIAIGRTSHNIHFGFYWGVELSDPDKKLIGEGNQYRYILVANTNDFPKLYMKKLMKEAYTNSLKKIKDKNEIIHGKTITKSISAKKRVIKKKK